LRVIHRSLRVSECRKVDYIPTIQSFSD